MRPESEGSSTPPVPAQDRWLEQAAIEVAAAVACLADSSVRSDRTQLRGSLAFELAHSDWQNGARTNHNR